MAMDNNQNQFGYVENSGMGIAGYEDCKESPQRNNPPMDTRTNKEDKPREENRKNSAPCKEVKDDDVLIFIPQEKKKECSLPTREKENRPKSGFNNSEIVERHVEIPDKVEKERPWEKDEDRKHKKKKEKDSDMIFSLNECEDWHFNRHKTGASHFRNGNENQQFKYRKKISYMDPEDVFDDKDLDISSGMDEIAEDMNLNIDKDIIDELNKDGYTPFDTVDDYFDPNN